MTAPQSGDGGEIQRRDSRPADRTADEQAADEQAADEQAADEQAADEQAAETPTLRPGWQIEPHPTRLDPAHPLRAEILRAHRSAVADSRGTYVDPASGYQVMTADTLARRGDCCDSGCRHCPWLPID